MQTTDSPTTGRPFWRSRWSMPLFALFPGALMLAAFSIGGRDGSPYGQLCAVAGIAYVAGGALQRLRS